MVDDGALSPAAPEDDGDRPVAEPARETQLADSSLAESPLAESPLAESPLAESPLAESPLAESPLVGPEPPAEPAPSDEPEPPRRRRWGWRIVGAAAAVLLGLAAYEVATWPDVAALAEANPETTAFIEHYKARLEREGKKPRVEWRWVAYPRIAGGLKRAVLVAEDIEFFQHQGFSHTEIEAAVRDALEHGKPLRGASTLTQQLAKNLWLSPSRNPWRKVKEAVLTWQLERELSKRRILELYLNVVEFGPGVYGAEAAARRYFGASAAGLSDSQAAALAAALPNPGRWHPGSGSKTARRRAERIEARMAKAAWLRKVV